MESAPASGAHIPHTRREQRVARRDSDATNLNRVAKEQVELSRQTLKALREIQKATTKAAKGVEQMTASLKKLTDVVAPVTASVASIKEPAPVAKVRVELKENHGPTTASTGRGRSSIESPARDKIRDEILKDEILKDEIFKGEHPPALEVFEVDPMRRE